MGWAQRNPSSLVHERWVSLCSAQPTNWEDRDVGNTEAIQPLYLWRHPVRPDRLIAAAVASFPLWGSGRFFHNWILAWLISWVLMLPAVVFAAPVIQSLSLALTRDDQSTGH
jgi:hypothetical protein